MTTIFVVCGKVNFTNLSRYSDLSERTYRRHYHTGMGLEPLNQELIAQVCTESGVQIGVVDCTFVAKSGKQTEGLDWFYNGKTQRAERGLEWSIVAIVDIPQNTGYSLSAQQTEAGLNQESSSRAQQSQPSQGEVPHSRVDFYLGHLAYCQTYFPPDLRYIVADGFYSKYKWVEGVVQLGYQAIGKLRSDAHLKFLYAGSQAHRGRPKRYDGKVDFADTSRFQFVQTLDDEVQLYTAVVWSVSLKRRICLAYLCQTKAGKRSYVLLFSTDLEQSPLEIVRYYKARFQIEFVIRDARQFTGLADCQARTADALDSHVNASLTALNLAKLALKTAPSIATNPNTLSIASLKRQALNQHLLSLFITMFDLDSTLIKSHPNYQKLLEYGRIAA